MLINNFTNPDVSQLCTQVANKAEVYHFPYNLGVAASWNLGMRKIISEQEDIVFILSTSAHFNGKMQQFIDHVIEEESRTKNDLYFCSARDAALHCFALTRQAIEKIGYFDENFWPIYYEDTDYYYRTKLEPSFKKHDCNLPIVKSVGASLTTNREPRFLQLYQSNAQRILTYYVAKWGGNQCSEKFAKPFNDPDQSFRDWIVKESFNNLLVNNCNWHCPDTYPYTERRI